MKDRFDAAAPSLGFWIVLSSWLAAAAFLVWASREPDLDRMKRELDRLASTDGTTASDWLVDRLRQELPRRPTLTARLAGESGARAIEARRDGFVRSAHFHVVIGPRVEALVLESTGRARVSIGDGKEQSSIALVAGRPQRFAVPASWRGRPELAEARRREGDGEIRVRGVKEHETP